MPRWRCRWPAAGRAKPATPSPPAAAGPRKAGGAELHLYNWNNYLAEETAKSFEESCKCKLVQDYYSDNEEMLAKLAAGATGYDLIVPTGNAVQTLIAQGALREIDHARIPNLANIKPEFLEPVLRSGQPVLGPLRLLDRRCSATTPRR